MSYLKERFEKEILPELQKELNLSSPMAVPRLKKVVVNSGLGDSTKDSSVIEKTVEDLRKITGQKPVITKAKIAISNFKIRKNDPIGAKVTLRGKKMWEFTEKMVDLVFPRIKDFKGISTKQFDGNGNLTVGLEDQTVFIEIDPNQVTRLQGMEITFVTTGQNDEASVKLLDALGFPFKETMQQRQEAKTGADKKASKSGNSK